jgi:hypothetical protein
LRVERRGNLNPNPSNPQDFELDVLGVKPGAQVPALLGKILNTLANDRNCK